MSSLSGVKEQSSFSMKRQTFEQNRDMESTHARKVGAQVRSTKCAERLKSIMKKA